jgi:peptidoglycan/xylan/chitin deacetylase (PgdA/CDA1 family)
MWNEMRFNDIVIKNIIGQRPVYMRPPFRDANAEVLFAMESWGYKVIDINLDTLDFLHNGKANEVELNFGVYNGGFADTVGQGKILLNHDYTAKIVEWVQRLVPDARSRGYTFVTSAVCTQAGPAYRV